MGSVNSNIISVTSCFAFLVLVFTPSACEGGTSSHRKGHLHRQLVILATSLHAFVLALLGSLDLDLTLICES